MTQITPAQLRTNFPEFGSTTRFPTGQIQFWLTFAYGMLNPVRWGAQLDMAAQLYAAHNIVLERQALDQANVNNSLNSGAPGVASGPISAKGVDKNSVSYSVDTTATPGEGDLNYTIYGQRLARLIRIFGMGPVYVNGPSFAPWFNSGAWAGPPFWPGWYGST